MSIGCFQQDGRKDSVRRNYEKNRNKKIRRVAVCTGTGVHEETAYWLHEKMQPVEATRERGVTRKKSGDVLGGHQGKGCDVRLDRYDRESKQ